MGKSLSKCRIDSIQYKLAVTLWGCVWSNNHLAQSIRCLEYPEDVTTDGTKSHYRMPAPLAPAFKMPLLPLLQYEGFMGSVLLTL